MDWPGLIALGFHTALALPTLLCCVAGALLGTLVGVVPGLGPGLGIALLLPAAMGLDATSALVLLAGVYYGAQYGASTSAILLDSPGDAEANAAAVDGHQMARQGRAGVALSIAALGSFFAGCVGTAILAALALPLLELAFRFGPAEYFSLLLLGLIGTAVLSGGSLVKALAMMVTGMLLGQVHTDALAGVAGYGLDIPQLGRGINFIAVAIGLFGFGEIVARLGTPEARRERYAERIERLRPTQQDLREAWPSMLRGTMLGSVLGVLPGGGALLAALASYELERKTAHPRVPFGRGAIQGVAGPGSANSAGAQTAFIPALMLGIPPNAVMALLVGAMTLKGIAPGPQVAASSPSLFWGVVASMWVGNLALLLLHLPLAGLWARLLVVPRRWLFPAVVALGCIGLYTLHQSAFDVCIAALFAVLGYAFHKLGCQASPLLVGFVLGPMLQDKLHQALQVSRGDWGTFVQRPLSAGLLAAAALLLVLMMLPSMRGQREEAFQER
jgi:TctA family transporter